MTRRNYFSLLVFLILFSAIIVSCKPTQKTDINTDEKDSGVSIQPAQTVNEQDNQTFTFTFKDGTCYMEGPASVSSGEVKVKFIIEDQSAEGFAVVAGVIDESATTEDLIEWPSTDQPPWFEVVGFAELFPEPHEKEFSMLFNPGEVHFVCFHPESKIGVTGPVEVTERSDAGEAEAIVRQVPTPAPDPVPVIIDTDMATDDWMAILYLLNRTDITIQAITVTGTGEAHCKPGIENALKLIKLAGMENIPVACGQTTPLSGNHTFPEDWRTYVDALMGLELPPGDSQDQKQDAVSLLKTTIDQAGQTVKVLTLGPLTNIAVLFREYSDMVEQIGMIYIMGGAVNVPGNLGPFVEGNTSAEWNIYVDPLAASEVLASGAPVTLIPLDATNQAPMTIDFFFRIEGDHPEPEAEFIYNIFSKNMGMIGSSYFWDPLAAGFLVDETIGTIKEQPICVETGENAESGNTYIEEGCPLVRFANGVDETLFIDSFINTLNAPSP